MVVFTYLHIEASFIAENKMYFMDRKLALCVDLVGNISDVVVKVSVKC